MKAVILAAGLGRRLHVLTQHRPKCLIEIGGKPLLYRYFDALLHLGVTRICLVVGYKQECIREAVASYPSTVGRDVPGQSCIRTWKHRLVVGGPRGVG